MGDCLDHPGGPNLITNVLIRGSESERRGVMKEAEIRVMHLEEATSQGTQAALEAQSSPQAAEETSLADILTLAW